MNKQNREYCEKRFTELLGILHSAPPNIIEEKLNFIINDREENIKLGNLSNIFDLELYIAIYAKEFLLQDTDPPIEDIILSLLAIIVFVGMPILMIAEDGNSGVLGSIILLVVFYSYRKGLKSDKEKALKRFWKEVELFNQYYASIAAEVQRNKKEEATDHNDEFIFDSSKFNKSRFNDKRKQNNYESASRGAADPRTPENEAIQFLKYVRRANEGKIKGIKALPPPN